MIQQISGAKAAIVLALTAAMSASLGTSSARRHGRVSSVPAIASLVRMPERADATRAPTAMP